MVKVLYYYGSINSKTLIEWVRNIEFHLKFEIIEYLERMEFVDKKLRSMLQCGSILCHERIQRG